MSCEHWKDNRCTEPAAIRLHGARPSPGCCARCPHYRGPDRGLGDLVHRMAAASGVKRVVERAVGGSCASCAKRRASLNDSIPF
jgi:hypothetical protein